MRPLRRAFSLLEMMVALAILAMGLVLLLQVEAQSAQLAAQGREITIATLLARGKLLDCQADLLKKGFSVGDYDEEGTFDDDGYPSFAWECHGYKPDMPVAEAGDVQQAFSGAGAGSTGDAVAGQAQGAGADMGMQFLAPVMSQMSSILGESIRELVVIVRWGEGEDAQEMSVTSHVIDKTAVNQVAAMIARQSGALDSLTGGSGAEGEDDGTGSGGGKGSKGSGSGRAPRLPGSGGGTGGPSGGSR